MPPAREPRVIENKQSFLLTQEENQHLRRLLGLRCQSLATCVIQLFITQAPYHSSWIKKDVGVLCFVKDNIRKNYFFRLFCFRRNQMVWEHEMYNNMEYIATMPYLHTFEGEECMVAFNFADVNEARDMKNIVEARIVARRRKQERREKNSIVLDQTEHQVHSNQLVVQKKYTDPAVKNAKRKRNITKADISTPSEFRHISHVGWDPNKGFDVNSEDAQLTEFFKQAGVSENELRDAETRKFIYDFVDRNGVRDVITKQQNSRRPPPAIPTSAPAAAGPPVPPRASGRSTHNRAAPPPPPPPLQTSIKSPSTQSASSANNGNGIPPSPVFSAPPPPPPPPPVPPLDMGLAPSNDEAQSYYNDIPQQPASLDMRSALLEDIQRGTTLRRVDERKNNITTNTTGDDARGDLLNEIRKGFQLKPANEREVKPVSPINGPASNDLAGALARALAERNRVIHSEDDSTSDTESDNDDEWDA